MLINHAALRKQDTQYDLVVVGAGPAGLTLVTELLGSGLNILLVEAGSDRETQSARADCRGVVAPGNGHPALDLYRTRALGGTSRIWGGRAIPLDRIDFERRPWIDASGWPIKFEDVDRYYPQAFEICEAGDGETDPARASPGEQPELIQGLDGPKIQTTIERFSRPTDFWKRFGPRLVADRHIHILKDAPAVRIGLARSGRLAETIELDLDGVRAAVAARAFVLASGGFETPRLLLASDDVCRHGIGNDSGLLGRYYMGHFCATLGKLTLSPGRAVSCDYERDRAGIYMRRRLWMNETAQRADALLNVTFRTHLPEPADPAHGDSILSAMFLAKSLVRREYAARFAEKQVPLQAYGRHVANIATGTLPLLRFAYRWTRDRSLASRKLPSVVRGPIQGGYTLEFHCEQSPCVASRVHLINEHDRHGMRRLGLDWHYNRSDVEALGRAYRILADRLASTGTGRLDVDLSLLETRMVDHGLSTGHHIGTTRMSDHARDGVVNRDGRVHGVGNLYVAGSSVFPTSGQANPTLTVVALALRLADKLRISLTSRERLTTTTETAISSVSEPAF